MGGGGGSSGGGIVSGPIKNNVYTEHLADMAENLFWQGAPLRSDLLNKYFTPFLQGNYNPETMPGFAPQYDLLRGAMEKQFGVAKNNIIGSTPRGGAMTDALANLEYNRARDTGLGTAQISANIINDLWNKAYNTGYGSVPQMAMQAMNAPIAANQSAINTEYGGALQAQQANAAMDQASRQQKGGGMGMLGTGIGSLLGLATAPITGGTSLFGSGLSSIGGMGAGKGATQGITSGLGGYSSLMSQANPLRW